MNHQEIKQQLLAFFDPELKSEVKSEINSHLSTCAECRGELAQWKKISGTLFHPDPISTPNWFVDSVMKKIDSLETASARLPETSWGWLVPGFGFALAGLLLVFSFFPADQTPTMDDLILAEGSSFSTTIENEFLDF